MFVCVPGVPRVCFVCFVCVASSPDPVERLQVCLRGAVAHQARPVLCQREAMEQLRAWRGGEGEQEVRVVSCGG